MTPRPFLQRWWWLAAVIAAASALLAVLRTRRRITPPAATDTPATARESVTLLASSLPDPTAIGEAEASFRWPPILLTAAGTLALTALALAQFGWPISLSSHLQFGLLVAGLVLLVFGLGDRGQVASDSMQSEAGFHILGFAPATLALLVLTLGAFLLRLWQLETSVRVLVDELALTQAVLRFEADAYVRLMEPISSIGGFAHFYPYVQMHAVNLLGHNFTGLRAASALLGALTIPGLYLLARALFNRPLAWVAALLLVTLPPHLHFSRLGLTEVAGVCCGVWALACLSRGMIDNRRLDWALGGVLLGLTHYFHESGRLLFTLLVILWIGGWWLACKPSGRVEGFRVAALAAALAALPVYAGIYGAGGAAAIRLADHTTGLSSDYWRVLFASGDFSTHIHEHILKPLLAYTHARDESLFYMGESALVLPLLVPLFILGLGYALYRWRKAGTVLVLLWLLAVTLGNSLLIVSVQTPRYVVALPAVALLLALGISLVSRGALALVGIQHPGARVVVMGTLALACAWFQADYYFHTHLPLYDRQFRAVILHPDGQDAVLRAQAFLSGTHLHMVSQLAPAPDYVHGLLSFTRPDLLLTILTPDQFTDAYLEALPMGISHAFFLEAYDIASLDRLRARLPVQAGRYSPYDLPLEKQFVLYYVPARSQGT